MPREPIDDELWLRIELLLPRRLPRNRQYAVRKPIEDRAVLTGIVFVLCSGIARNRSPQEIECGSGTICWRHWISKLNTGSHPSACYSRAKYRSCKASKLTSAAGFDSSTLPPCIR